MSLPPGPTENPAIQLWHWMQRPIEFLERCHDRYGDTFTVRLPILPPIIVVCAPDDVRTIFSGGPDEMLAGAANRSLEPFLGKNSLLLLDGEPHARHRKLLLPPFHGERMQAYGRDMLGVTDESIDRWSLAKPFRVHPLMQRVTLDVILRTVFGMYDAHERTPFMNAITELLDLGAWPPLLLPAMQRDLGPWSPWGRFQRALRRGDELLYETIRRRRAEGDRGRADILSLLLSARDDHGEAMSDAELRDELVTLVVAGHETTATSLSWALRWVLADPKLYRRLRDEVAPLAARGPLVPEQVQKLELLDATVKEALRLVPVVMMVGRHVQHPVRIGGYDLPAKSFVAPNILLAHRRSETYPNPMKFDPDRFVGVRSSPFEFLPFGGGLRRCIGAAFAQYEMKMVLATVFARTALRLAPDQRIVPVRRSITMTPSGGVRVIIDVRRPRLGEPVVDHLSVSA